MFPSTYDCCGITLQVYKLLQFRVGNLPKMTDSGAMCQPTSRIVNVVGVLSEVVGLFNSSTIDYGELTKAEATLLSVNRSSVLWRVSELSSRFARRA